MSYTVGPGAILEVSLDYRLFGQQILLVRHYWIDPDDIGGPWDGFTTGDEFRQAFDTPVGGITDKLSTYQTTEMHCNEIRWQWIHPVRYAYRSSSAGVTDGVYAPPTMPQNTSLVGTLQSDTKGRIGRGNVFFTGWGADTENGGLLTGLAKSHVESILNYLTASFTTATDMVTLEPIIFHREVPSESKLINHYKAQDTVRVMRRRTVGLGT